MSMPVPFLLYLVISLGLVALALLSGTLASEGVFVPIF